MNAPADTSSLSASRGRRSGGEPAPEASPDATAAAERPRIVGILNAYGATGANRCQVIIRADHAVEILGDELSLARPLLLALRSVDLRRFGNRRR